MLEAFVFIFGLILGSFFNVVLLRKNTGESAVKGGSRCFSCGKKLSWFELIPILSFIIQRGKCGPPAGGCGSRISLQYPIIEILAGCLALAVYWRTGFVLPWAYYFAAFSLLFLIHPQLFFRFL